METQMRFEGQSWALRLPALEKNDEVGKRFLINLGVVEPVNGGYW
jgi:hypothetical protein